MHGDQSTTFAAAAETELRRSRDHDPFRSGIPRVTAKSGIRERICPPGGSVGRRVDGNRGVRVHGR